MKKPIPGSLMIFKVVSATWTPEHELAITMSHPDMAHALSFIVQEDTQIERMESLWLSRLSKSAMDAGNQAN